MLDALSDLLRFRHVMRINRLVVATFSLACLFLIGCSEKPDSSPPLLLEPEKSEVSTTNQIPKDEKRKIFLIDSYHKGYEWSDEIVSAILKHFDAVLMPNDVIDSSKSDYQFKIFRMDTKRRKDEDYKCAIGASVAKMIEKWCPDLIVASDDNASKYVIHPYVKNSEVPVVFCGLNFRIERYGFPCDNVTGIVEVDLFADGIKVLRNYAKGDRVGFLAPNVISARNGAQACQYNSNINLEKSIFVHTFSEWKKAFVQLQDEVDMLIMLSYYGIPDYDREEARKFALKTTKIPSMSTLKWMAPVSLLCVSKVPAEQGRLAAEMAARVLKGTSPSEIPIVKNKESVLLLNMAIAKKLGLKLPISIIDKASFVEIQAKGDEEK